MSTEQEVQSVYFDIAKSISKLSNVFPAEGCIAVVNNVIVSTGYTYKPHSADSPLSSVVMCAMNYLSCSSVNKDAVDFYLYSENKQNSADQLSSILSYMGVSYTLRSKSKYVRTSKKVKDGVVQPNTRKIIAKPGSKPKLYGTTTCPVCGDTFDRKSPRQKYCNHPKIAVCKVCHKVFQYRCDGKDKPVTCGSPQCVKAIRRQHVLDMNKSRVK